MAGALPALAIIGAGAVAIGEFEPTVNPGWFTLSLAICVVIAGMAEAARRWRHRGGTGLLREAAGPLIWTVAIWMVYRFLLQAIPQIIVLPAGYLAWLAITYSLGIVWLPLVAALCMETLLALTGIQTPLDLGINLTAFGTVTAGLFLFARSRVYRRQLRQAFKKKWKEATSRELAKDFGLIPSQSIEGLGKLVNTRFSTIDILVDSLELQLELLRQAMGLTTVAVLWPDAEKQELRLHGHASARKDLVPGPYPPGQGIIGALYRTGDEISVAPVPRDYNGLPYYRSTTGVGSLYALKIADENGLDSGSGLASGGILCVDRVEDAPWDETACRLLQLAARKIAKEVALARRLEETDQERHTIQQVYHGLRELNAVLDLESAFAASVKAIQGLVHADFTAISLVENDRHKIVYAEGPGANSLKGLDFPEEEGMIGQVLRLNRALPLGGTYRGEDPPVFSMKQRLPEFGSLLILPLNREKEKPLGVLVVAAHEEGVFTETGLQILELIATQVAVKIHLAQVHERINNMATTDGLTGLANHRNFQNGFDRMLCRAEREKDSLCLLLCDLDYFKQINDTHGHPFGDKVLKAVAEILAGDVRQQLDLAARYGGEEFAVLLENTDRRQGMQVAERIRRKVQSLTLWNGKDRVTLTFSIGLAVYPEDGQKKTQLIARADQALYHAKGSGRNRVSAWALLPQTIRGQGPTSSPLAGKP
jgi:diguanylate cyclase (GGDEF)-like protein